MGEPAAVIRQELAPIIIGISGASDLEGEDAAVCASLKAIFDRLDEKYPFSPKILLTTLAKGADILGAEDVLDREGWEIVVPLPLQLDVYLTDFDHFAATRLRNFVQESSNRKKLRLFTLDPLRPLVERRPTVSSELGHSPETIDPDRLAHCEQAGLFIAERCAILIAVTGADQKDNLIGSAERVVQYRLNGHLDSAARHIVQRSHVLVEPTLLDVPPVGPVWLIDLASIRLQGDLKNRTAFKILFPADQRFPKSHQLRESLRLADRLNEFNIRAQCLDRKNMLKIEGVPSNMNHGAAILHELMHALSTIQIDINRKLKYSVCSLAVLFCTAIFMFEAQLDLNKRWGVFGYIIALVLGMSIYKFAWSRRWQPIAQDYRAVSESLRVQIAWWNGGLAEVRHRVDRFYLRGATGSLGLVRAAVRHMVDAAALLSPREEHAAESQVRSDHDSNGSSGNKAVRQDIDSGLTWIEEQIAYFEDRLGKRRTWVSFVDAAGWFLLVASLCPEVVVAVNSIHGDIVRPVLDKYLGQLHPGVAFIAIVTVIILAFVTSSARWLLSRSARMDRDKRVFETPHIAVSLVAGLLLSIALYKGAAFLGYDNPSNSTLIIGGVSVASIAYGMQFVCDRLSWPGEMRGYADALEIFRRARSALKEIDGLEADGAERTVLRKTVLEALGKEALKENESWLRTHRERPLEPLPPV
jgi:hypothetical protein